MNDSSRQTIRKRDVIILGFAFFATYFGAGNLIFPPHLGLNSGSDFLSGLAGLTLSGIFLPIFTLIVIGLNGDVHTITDKVGKYTYRILLAALMLVLYLRVHSADGGDGHPARRTGEFSGSAHDSFSRPLFPALLFLRRRPA